MMNDVEIRKQFYSQISLEGLSPEYRESNERLLAAFEEIQTKIRILDGEGLDEDERSLIRGQTYAAAKEAGRLMKTQRQILLNDMGQFNLRLTEEQTQDFSTFVETVERLTNMEAARSVTFRQ